MASQSGMPSALQTVVIMKKTNVMSKSSPAKTLHRQLATFLNKTKVKRDEVTEVLISLLAIQLASYDPLIRLAAWNSAVDVLDLCVEKLADERDAKYSDN